MKKWFSLLMAAVLLTGCAPGFQDEKEVVQESDDSKKETSIIPNYQLQDSYRSLIPFVPSKARGMVVSNLNSRYDIDEFETGLMRVAMNQFSPEKYVFQEGQYLDKETVSLWLNRKFTKEQLKERGLKEEQNVGLNPLNDGKGSIEEQNERNPIYLAHILEHNYLIKNDKSVKLSGVVIGLALNSVHYYQKEKYGATFEQKISRDKLEAEGKKIADEVINRMRNMKGLGDVPITIALFEQKGKNDVIPGTFFAYAVSENGNSLGDWKKIDEKYVLFPSEEAEKNHRDDQTFFMRFKDDIEEYFPNYNGVIGRGFYKDGQLVDMNIEIPVQMFGEAEMIGFTQWATSLIIDHFPDYINVEVEINSVNGAEALIVREAGQEEPFVHIY
ncbi:CamS family sex pheromone protein [Siminovitchia sediminis]|uniref:CamS family sex pheromone protein n=1 Tax=Siminovitchia sediminis TaxID=1274353 RepID=A0ABW4KL31_9BACI